MFKMFPRLLLIVLATETAVCVAKPQLLNLLNPFNILNRLQCSLIEIFDRIDQISYNTWIVGDVNQNLPQTETEIINVFTNFMGTISDTTIISSIANKFPLKIGQNNIIEVFLGNFNRSSLIDNIKKNMPAIIEQAKIFNNNKQLIAPVLKKYRSALVNAGSVATKQTLGGIACYVKKYIGELSSYMMESLYPFRDILFSPYIRMADALGADPNCDWKNVPDVPADMCFRSLDVLFIKGVSNLFRIKYLNFFSSNEFDVTDSPVISTVKDIDVTENDIEVTKNDTDVTKNDFDATENDIDVTENSIDVTESGFDVTENHTDVTENEIDITKSDIDVTENNTDVTENDVDATENNINVTKSDIGVIENNIDVTENEIDITKTDIDVTENNTDVTENDVDVTENNINVTKSDIGVIENNIDVTENDVDVTENNINLTKSDIGETENNIDVTKNDIDLTKSDIDVTDNDIDKTKNHIDVTENVINLTEDSIDETDNPIFFMESTRRHDHRSLRNQRKSSLFGGKKMNMKQMKLVTRKNGDNIFSKNHGFNFD